jgi:hypothetical protein
MALFRRRKRIPSEEAETLIRYLSEPDYPLAESFIARVSIDHRDAFLEKMFLYQLAAVMVCLLAREKHDGRFGEIRKSFEEKTIFPMLGSHGGEGMIVNFTQAMGELANLEKPVAEARPLSWARDWLSAIGVDIVNPVDLTLFVTLWQQKLYYTLKVLIEVGDAF